METLSTPDPDNIIISFDVLCRSVTTVGRLGLWGPNASLSVTIVCLQSVPGTIEGLALGNYKGKRV